MNNNEFYKELENIGINLNDIQKEQFVKWLIKSKNEFSRVEIFNEIINDLPLFQFGEEYKS